MSIGIDFTRWAELMEEAADTLKSITWGDDERRHETKLAERTERRLRKEAERLRKMAEADTRTR